MGMNFYHCTKAPWWVALIRWATKTPACPACGADQKTHIGKSSAGWSFSFHGTATIRSWVDWQKRLQAGEIWDQYGGVWTLEALKDLVEGKTEGRRHFDYMRDHYIEQASGHWLDDEGHSFSEGDFS